MAEKMKLKIEILGLKNAVITVKISINEFNNILDTTEERMNQKTDFENFVQKGAKSAK